MNKPILSIVLPSIRSKNLKKFYDSVCLACKKYKFELIIVSPYDLPEELNNIGNIKLVRSFACPTVATQIGALFASGKFLFNTTDDGILLENTLDNVIELWNKNNLQKFDTINCRYREGCLDVDTLKPLTNLPPELPLDYWNAQYHDMLKLKGINFDWKISLHFFILLDTFYQLGGLDCIYEYSNFAIHELIFDLQKHGGKVINSESEVGWFSHLPNRTSDHFAVHDAQSEHDWPIFYERHNKDNYIKNSKYDNWKNYSNFWYRRFDIKEECIKKDISITFPSIRNKNLIKVYNAIKESCKNHTFELVICSPNNPLIELPKENVKWIKSFASPSVCWQMCYMISNSEFVIDGSDDALFLSNVLDQAIEAYKSNNLQKYDCISMELSEGTLNPDNLEPLENAKTHTLNPYFFHVHANPPFKKKCINQNWKLSLNFLIKLNTFLEMGGFDCRFNYVNHSLHDFIFRLQSLGGRVFRFPNRSLLVSHLPEHQGDHGPVHNGQKEDEKIFDDLYNNLDTLESRRKIDFDDWKNYDHSLVWNKRFKDIKV